MEKAESLQGPEKSWGELDINHSCVRLWANPIACTEYAILIFVFPVCPKIEMLYYYVSILSTTIYEVLRTIIIMSNIYSVLLTTVS